MNRWTKVSFAGCLLFVLAGMAWLGCSKDKPSGNGANATYSGSYPIQVTCTTGMVADMVTAVGGEHVNVSRMMGETVDPHTYQPTVADNRALLKCDLICYSGLHLEPGFLKVFGTLSQDKPVLAVADGLVESGKLIKLEGEFYDPHVWFEPELWADCVGIVSKELSRFDPKNADTYVANAKKYEARIRELVTYGKGQIGSIPEPRTLVTAHDAFQYFGKTFDIEVVAIQGVSTETEAGTGRINELVDLLVERRIKAVFVESSISDKNVQALLEGCKARGHEVKIGGELYSDALGPKDSPAGEYLGMVRHNIDTVTNALK